MADMVETEISEKLRRSPIYGTLKEIGCHNTYLKRERNYMLGFLFGTVGIIGFFTGTWWVSVVSAIICVLLQVIQIVKGNQNGITTVVLASIIGWGVSGVAGVPWWAGVCVAICIEDVAMTIIGWIALLILLISNRK